MTEPQTNSSISFQQLPRRVIPRQTAQGLFAQNPLDFSKSEETVKGKILVPETDKCNKKKTIGNLKCPSYDSSYHFSYHFFTKTPQTCFSFLFFQVFTCVTTAKLPRNLVLKDLRGTKD